MADAATGADVLREAATSGEFQRRLVHALGTLVPVPYLLDRVLLDAEVIPWEWVVWFTVAGTGLAAILEALRLSGRLDWRIFEVLTREYEQDNPAGYALYAVGMAAVAVAFEPRVAIPAMFMLTIGDPISGLLGSGGAREIKAAYVLAAMFAVCFVLAVPFVGPVAAALGALVATVADGVKPVVAGYVIDDNVTIPVGGGVAMWVGITFLPAVGP